MKKSLRKLSLSRETLRTLENAALERLAGGGKPQQQTTTCTSTPILACDYTMSSCPGCPET